MARPFRKLSLSGVASVKSGDSQKTKGHDSIGLYAAANGLEPASDTLEIALQGGVENYWANIETLTQSDFTEVDGVYTASRNLKGIAVERVRASILGINDAAGDDLEVDVFVLGTNNAGGSGRAFRED